MAEFGAHSRLGSWDFDWFGGEVVVLWRDWVELVLSTVKTRHFVNVNRDRSVRGAALFFKLFF